VVFDWKGTLEPKQGNKHTREQEALNMIGRLLGPEKGPQFIELYIEEKSNAQKDGTEKHCFTKSSVLYTVLDKMNLHDHQFRENLVHKFFAVYNVREKKCMYPQAKEILEELFQQEIPMALIRNSSLPREEFQICLQESDAEKYFHVDKNVVLSGEVGAEKPNTQIFYAALQKCNMTELHAKAPERILFIGNELEADVVGGNRMGWKTVLVTHTEDTSNGCATWDISDLIDLIPIIFEAAG